MNKSIAQCEKIHDFLFKFIQMATSGELLLSIMDPDESNQRETLEDTAMEQHYYQDLLLTSTEQIASMLKEITSKVSLTLKHPSSNLVDHTLLLSLDTFDQQDCLAPMSALAWILPFAAKSLRSVGKGMQERLLVAGDNLIMDLRKSFIELQKIHAIIRARVSEHSQKPRKIRFFSSRPKKPPQHKISVTLIKESHAEYIRSVKVTIQAFEDFLDRIQRVEMLLSLLPSTDSLSEPTLNDKNTLDFFVDPVDAVADVRKVLSNLRRGSNALSQAWRRMSKSEQITPTKRPSLGDVFLCPLTSPPPSAPEIMFQARRPSRLVQASWKCETRKPTAIETSTDIIEAKESKLTLASDIVEPLPLTPRLARLLLADNYTLPPPYCDIARRINLLNSLSRNNDVTSNTSEQSNHHDRRGFLHLP